MKPLIIGTPRTRTSFILNTICSFYKAKNYFELYTEEQVYVRDYCVRQKGSSPKEFSVYYNQRLQQIKQKIFFNDKFGIKIFPTHFYNSLQIHNQHTRLIDESFKESIFKNISDLFHINLYDNIYLLHRYNLTDIILSYVLSKNSMVFRYTTPLDFKRDPLKIENFSVTDADYALIDSLIMCHLLIDNIEQYLTKYSLPYTKLEYSQIPAYAEKNYPNVDSGILENKFNYREIAPNYNEVNDYVEKRKLELYNISKDIEFY